MADEKDTRTKKAARQAEKARKKEEKRLKKAGNNAEAEMEEESGGKGVIVIVTLLIVIIWIGILAVLVKLDVGGFGSTVLQPILKDVPYINKILPETKEEEPEDAKYPYATLAEATARIKELEKELSDKIESQEGNSQLVEQLQAENDRLQQFEQEQAAFQEEKTKFYEEVVYSDQAPDIEEYKAYYESIDPANAEVLYKQVVEQQQEDQEVLDYASAYSSMKPSQAAKILEQMTDNLELAAKILRNIDTEARGDILGAMDPAVASRLTAIMEP